MRAARRFTTEALVTKPYLVLLLSAEETAAEHPTMMVALGAETAPAIKDFTGAAISFFNNHRVPAALLAASSIKDAFVLQGRGSKLPEDDARAWRLVRYAYLLLMITSFGMEMCAVELFNRSVPACTL